MRLDRRPAPRDYQKQPPGRSFPLPAPSLGMNTRDSVSALDPREARVILNMVAEGGKLVIRNGKAAHQTLSGTSSVGSIWTHQGVSGDILLAMSGGKF